jgi:hypothetical protein
MSKIDARLFISGIPTCHGPLCTHKVEDPQQAVFLIRQGVTLAFCTPTCHQAFCHLQLDQLRANQELKQQPGDYLVRLGYTLGSGEDEAAGA